MAATHLIIGGATRAATTSLFMYLAEHPQVCCSTVKETRFFLDAEYPLSRLHRFEDGLQAYSDFFNHCPEGIVRMEATPDYLFSPGTAQRIRDALGSRVRLVFILREPIDRLVSWYRFARQTGRLAVDTSFEEYIYLQLRASGSDRSAPQHLRALEQGCFSRYLNRYYCVFEKQQILVIRFEALRQAPRSVLSNICHLIGVDPDFYDAYQFRVYNPSVEIRDLTMHKLYKMIVRRTRLLVRDRSLTRKALRSLHYRLEKAYLRFNLRPDEKVVVPSHLRATLEDYYRAEPEALAGLLGLSSWSWQSPVELPGKQG